MSKSFQPWYECKDDILTVTWPTDDVFAIDTDRDVLYNYEDSIGKRLKTFSPHSLEMVVLDHGPP